MYTRDTGVATRNSGVSGNKKQPATEIRGGKTMKERRRGSDGYVTAAAADDDDDDDDCSSVSFFGSVCLFWDWDLSVSSLC